MIRRVLSALALVTMGLPAMAAPVPIFASPVELLEAVYAQQVDEVYDPDLSFLETDTFSIRLSALFAEADAKLKATGDEMGALDFSPFINGQDSGGLSFDIIPPKTKGDRAVAEVNISLFDEPLSVVTFHFINEGAARGWKVDDILLPMGDAEGTWSLAEYFADPFIP